MHKQTLNIKPNVAQYIVKALDYLAIYSKKHDEPDLVEPELHETAEDIMTDVILFGMDN